MYYFLAAIIGYVIGSIPASYVVARIMGKIDIRNEGSGNAGTTNVLRTLGPKAAGLALVGDFFKGSVAVLLCRYFMGDSGEIGAMVAGYFAVLGHCYPFTIGFRGGKGVATSAGVILALNPIVFAFLLVIQIFVILATRYMSLASIVSAVVFPVISYLAKLPMEFVVFSLFFSGLVIIKHKDNIKRLLSGTEKRFSFKKEEKK